MRKPSRIWRIGSAIGEGVMWVLYGLLQVASVVLDAALWFFTFKWLDDVL